MPEPSLLRYERYGRYWAVYEDDALLCVTVYKKGALAVIHRLGRTGPAAPIVFPGPRCPLDANP